MAAASSDVFRTFFKLLFGTILFGVVHGLLLTPVLLAIIYTLYPPAEADMRTHAPVHPPRPVADADEGPSRALWLGTESSSKRADTRLRFGEPLLVPPALCTVAECALPMLPPAAL